MPTSPLSAVRALRRAATASLLLALSAAAVMSGRPSSRLVAGPGQFLFDGHPLQIISGELHYPRIPREYWRDRLRKARAMGLNTISTYVFWNVHEETPGQYDFTGQKDVAAFVRLAQGEGLHVILRPGPYVCAEWELGGYPGWLFAEPGIVLRSTDARFTRPAARWLDRLGRELAPLMASRGGPIMAVQVENEYGSFGQDHDYLIWQRDALRHAGFGDALLYTADGPGQLPHGTLADLPAVVNFGPGEAQDAFARLHAFRADGLAQSQPPPQPQPLMSGEYWAGWFDQWGRPHAATDAAQQARELAWMLDQGHSVNLYMFHGGTTFGFMNGANVDRGRYLPQTTSYDYDAALDESGRPTPKYFAFRDLIDRHTGETLPSVPVSDPPIAVPSFTLAGAASLWATLGRGVHVDRPRSMESFGQAYGYILYRTHARGPAQGDLVIKAVRDYAQVYVNGALVGTLDRRLDQDRLGIRIPAGGAQLDILVENSGRVNFAAPLRDERKGITGTVTLGDEELTGWDVFPLPMPSTPTPRFSGDDVAGPGFYSGTFQLASTGDTFLDTRGWGKGTVWINGHHLGRFWSIGPQQTLYVPGAWLRRGSNTVVVFDLEQPARRDLAGLTKPILDQVSPGSS